MPAVSAAVALLIAALTPQDLKTPEEFFGHRVGEDRKIISYSRIVKYLEHLAEKSDRMELHLLGKSTLGNDVALAVISTPENRRNGRRYAGYSRKLFEARIEEREARRLAKEGKAIVLMTFNIHSTEIGTSQTPAELAYQVVRGKVPLDDVIFLLMPSINPDGQLMIKEWYDKYVGTEFEGGPMPKLYHFYAGHDNNRDGYMLNLDETRLVAKVHYQDWFPQVAVDHHQMGSTGARMWVPPYGEPLNDTIHPLIHRWLNVFGTHMALDLERSGRTGVQSQRRFEAYWPGATDSTPWWHNRIGILTESASSRIATPLFVDSSEAAAKQESVTQPRPWKGGWWRMRDIVDQELTASYTVLELAARYKEEILFHTWRMGRDAIRKGETEPPYAYLLPPRQNDFSALERLVGVLHDVGVRIEYADEAFELNGRSYPASMVVIPLAQSNRAYVRNLFGRQVYPREDRPYDMAGWTLPLQMGLEAVEVREKLSLATKRADAKLARLASGVPKGKYVAVSAGNTRAFSVANSLLHVSKPVYRLAASSGGQRAGTFVFRNDEGDRERLRQLRPQPLSGSPDVYALRSPRLAVYQPWRPSMDEGWTRLVLRQFDFKFETVRNGDVAAGGLREKHDVILIPDISPDVIRDGRSKSDEKKPERYPPEYQGGIGKKGVEALKAFVEGGGTLILLDSACDFAISEWGLPVRNTLKDDRSFSCPGSILKVRFDPAHPVGFGMPENGHLLFVRSPALQTSIPPRVDIDRHVVARYDEEESALVSGYLNEPDKLKGRAALVEVAWGKGRFVLFAFRPQHRAQSYGTFKMLFNAILLSHRERVKLP